MPEKNMLNSVTTCARPPRIWPISACDKAIIRPTTLAEVISSPTNRKNGTAKSASESMPLKSWPIMEGRLTGVSIVATSTPAVMLNTTGTPRYPRPRNKPPIRSRIAPWLTATRPSQDVHLFARLVGRFETVAPAVDELLDGEEGNQHAGDRDRCVERGDRRHRRHAEAAEALPEIDVAEVDHAERDCEHDQAAEGLDREPQRARPLLASGPHTKHTPP